MSARSQASAPPSLAERGRRVDGVVGEVPPAARDGATRAEPARMPLAPRGSRRPLRALRYTLALLGAAGLLALTGALQPMLQGVLFSIPLAATAIATLLLGAGPGLLFSTAVGVGSWYWFLEPQGSLALAASRDGARVVSYFAAAYLFVLAIALVDGMRGKLQAAKARAEKTEAALRRSEAILAQAGEMAHLGAWWIEISPHGLEASPLRWSDEVYRIFGYAPGSVAITNEVFFERVHPEDRRRIRSAIARALAERRPYTIEHRVVRPDGTERTVLEHGEFAFDDLGHPMRIVGAVQDVTDLKRAEAALREADRRKDEFLGILSHELRNPLAPIRNALWILDRANCGTPQAASARAVINRQVGHLSRIVDDLLDVTRISRGKIHLQRSRMDLAELLSRTVEDHRTLFHDRHVSVAVRTDVPVWIDADATRVAQVIGNLLQNAAKFTIAGGHVDVALERDGAMALVRVRDDGIGIPAAILGRIFEPFIQADETLHRAYGGLGLGLALVKGLVDLHGGSVEAHSDGPGRGSELAVRLPIAHEKPPLLGVLRPAAAPMARRRVLVIEDNVDAAETLREMLLLWNHEVQIAHDGRTGVETARTFRPEIVLCDIGLPEMDGYEVARAIRADPSLASTFLVAVTGYALPEDQRRAADAGFSRHLAKPVPVEVIEEVLATAPCGG